ncbi:hypothetical protein [Oceanobacillus senegalensis]|uniref:hypothetical protein n=1 Tax=Oceanobacillus senegalensis TaxID=1936063 RepID=UPI000A30591C|nr:hypothetical protein [Oceanobacillus senegalensis]
MTKYFFIFSFLLVISVGCSNNSNQPVIQKADNNATSSKEPTIQEETIEDEYKEFIEFQVEKDHVRVDVQAIPILSQYLTAVKHRKSAVEEMKLEKLPITEQPIYLLEFSCKKELCSYLLLSQNKDKRSYLVADLARYENVIPSPDQTKFIIEFSRSSDNLQSGHHLIAFDIKGWSPLLLQTNTGNSDILNYHWPYKEVEWLDESSLSIKVSDTDSQPTKENKDIENKTIQQTTILHVKE